MRIALGFMLAFGIGVVCRVGGVPLPAPTALIGALLVVSMSVGYSLSGLAAQRREARNRALAGGPSGKPLKSGSEAP